MKKITAFTLLELLVVIAIILILSGIAIPNYNKTKERAIKREAVAILKLVFDAEKIYKMQSGSYYPASGSESNVTAINNNLALMLSETNWDYYITGGSGTFTANADRKGSGGYLDCAYYITESMNEPGTSTPASCP